jgi:hypothetical protein
MLDREGSSKSKPFDIKELRATSARNRYKLISDPKSCEAVIAALHQEYCEDSFQHLEAIWHYYVQIIFPYLFRAAEAGATFFPIHQLPPEVLPSDQVMPLVWTRSNFLVWTGAERFSGLFFSDWDYYHAQGFDNTIVRLDDGFTWFLTW